MTLADSDRPNLRSGLSVYQTAHAVLRRQVRAELVAAAGQAGPGGFGSVTFRGAAVLYALLLEHAIDRRARCCVCRRPGSRIGLQRRRCRIYPLAQFWLGQPGTVLTTSLTHDLGLPAAPPPRRARPADWPGLRITGRTNPDDDTDGVPAPGTAPFRVSIAHQAPADPPATFFPGGVPQARRPVPDHGGAAENTAAPGLTVAHLLPELLPCPA
jgi:hypothetical protein